MNKNVHLIPTDGISEDNYIYISNEEDIQKDSYCYCDKYNRIFKYFGEGSLLKSTRKIVLTNDPTLIADGIQEISSSFLSSFVENPTNYAEISKELKAFDEQGREIDFAMEKGDYTKSIYSVKFPQKEHQILTDLKDYFKNTSPEKIKSDWEECEKYDRVGTKVDEFLHQNELIREFESLEGVTFEQFDEKDWTRFTRFCENRAKEIKTEEKLYTKEDMIKASKYGYDFHKTTQFPNQEFEDSCIRNTQQWLMYYKTE